MNKMTNFIRANAGRNSVPSGYVEHRADNSNRSESFYNGGIFEFETETMKKEKRPVVWAETLDLLEIVLENRALSELDVNIKVLTDVGQNFYQISMTVFQPSKKEFVFGGRQYEYGE
ncbi:hypothetical protein QAD02_021657 [Eretmocerus hayati]|uniref:Uncharacterized protein n=1 Tax=Eretmocerus hayati TaxID=131215 RepID=A0ACC2PTC8_9HYME|nr:hypothetical protein QAD02_021657 [Eretmocerus hayati]